MPPGSSFLSTFIYYFAVAAIGITAVVSQATDLKIATGIPQQLGAVGGRSGRIGRSLLQPLGCHRCPIFRAGEVFSRTGSHPRRARLPASVTGR